MTLGIIERARVRRYFVICACNLRHFRMYWLPTPAPTLLRKSRKGGESRSGPRCVVARAVMGEKRHALPPDAVEIGVYTHPCEPKHFLGDLDAVLARLNARAPKDQHAADDEDIALA